MATSKLLELGHRNLLFLIHPDTRTGKPEVMSALKYKGALSAVKTLSGCSVRKSVVTLHVDEAVIKISTILRSHRKYTGFLLPGLQWFEIMKSVLEEHFPERIPEIDIVVFDGCRTPLFFGQKSAIICGWDGVELGKKAVQRLLLLSDDKSERSRITFIPMDIYKNTELERN